MYTLVTTPTARRALKKLPRSIRKALITELEKIQENPLATPTLKPPWTFLRSLHTRLNGTDYRVVYEVDIDKQEIIVHYAASRENFYRVLRQLKLKPAA